MQEDATYSPKSTVLEDVFFFVTLRHKILLIWTKTDLIITQVAVVSTEQRGYIARMHRPAQEQLTSFQLFHYDVTKRKPGLPGTQRRRTPSSVSALTWDYFQNLRDTLFCKHNVFMFTESVVHPPSLMWRSSSVLKLVNIKVFQD